ERRGSSDARYASGNAPSQSALKEAAETPPTASPVNCQTIQSPASRKQAAARKSSGAALMIRHALGRKLSAGILPPYQERNGSPRWRARSVIAVASVWAV